MSLRKAKVLVIVHFEGRADGIRELITSTNTELEFLKLPKGSFSSDTSAYNAIILSGGPMSVYDINKAEYEFLEAEQDYLRTAISRNVPILGICFGHQLLAHILGGRVEKADKEEIGWARITLTSEGTDDPIFIGLEKEFYSFQYHRDHVAKLPSGGIKLAESDQCAVESFRYKSKPVWGVQFHPEISPQRGELILSSRKEALTQQGFNVNSIIAKGYRVFGKVGEQLLGNFLSAIK